MIILKPYPIKSGWLVDSACWKLDSFCWGFQTACEELACEGPACEEPATGDLGISTNWLNILSYYSDFSEDAGDPPLLPPWLL